MKKFLLFLMLTIVSFVNANAQIVDNGTIKDNWYIGGGVGTQIWDNTNSWNDFSPIKDQQLNINVYGGKYFTPYLGTELAATALFNTGAESNFIDGHLISLNGVANLSNLIAGYKGKRYFFNLEAIIGAGWYHAYVTGHDYNHSALRGALRGNFKVSKDLDVYIMPEYISLTDVNNHFNMNPQGINIYAGVKWNIPSIRGGFPICRLYDDAEIQNLNNRINELQAELAKKPTVEYINNSIVKNIDNSYTVFFDKGKSDVANIADIAKVLNETNGTITIIGSTSPEGSERINKKLAWDRAEAVRQALVEAGVNAQRIYITNDYSKQRRATIVVN